MNAEKLKTLAGLAARGLREIPVTLLLVAIMWILFALESAEKNPTETIFGFLPGDAIASADWITAGLTAGTLVQMIPSTIAAFVFAAPAEVILGSRRFTLTAFVMSALAMPIGMVSAHVVEALGMNQWGADLLSDAVLTPIGWIFGTAAVATGAMPMVWSRRIRVALWTITLALIAFSGTMTDFVALAAVALGVLIGMVQIGGASYVQPLKTHLKSSLREGRLLVGVVLFGVALGPVIVALSPQGHSPLALASSLMWTPAILSNYVENVCAQSGSIDACSEAVRVVNERALGATVASFMPLLLQSVLSYGLAKGRRTAWWMSLLLQVVTVVVLVVQLDEFTEESMSWGIFLLNFVWLLLPWIACIALLLFTRRWFFVEIEPRAWKQFAVVLAALAAVTGGLALGAVLTVSNGNTVFQVVQHALTQLPANFLPVTAGWIEDPATLHPLGATAQAITQWASNILWAGLSLALLQLLSSVPNSDNAHGAATMRAMLQEGTGDHLQWMTLWEGNRYWFSQGEVQGGVAYRVKRGIAVTVGEPVIGANLPESMDVDTARLQLAREFLHFANSQGWQVAWYSVRSSFADAIDRDGFKRLHVAEESVMSTANTEFKGKKFQNIRTARNRAIKEGVYVQWGSWESLGAETQQKILALSEEWVAEKTLPEMGFTLGTVDELAVPGTMLLIAMDEQGVLHGVTSWLPVHEDGRVVGYTLDFMRRNAQGFRPVIEYLLAEATIKAAELGCEWVSLSGAPLAPSNSGEAKATLLSQALNAAGAAIEPLYGFRSLAFSKNKFHPEHHGWYLCYNDELALPSIGLAVSQCYLPQMKAEDASNVFKQWIASRQAE